MSGSGGGIIIIGDKPLVEELEANQHLVADFRLIRMQEIIEQYEKTGNVSASDQLFLLRCAQDIVDHE